MVNSESNESSSKIGELKQSLYRRGQKNTEARPWARFAKKESELPMDWEHEHNKNIASKKPKNGGVGLPIKLFVFSVIFFVAALSIATFIILRGTNLVSSDNIDLIVSGPVLVGGGETLSLQIDVINRNSATLELVDLIIEFPEGSRSEEGSAELLRIRESLGDVAPGGRVSKTISARMFGEENVQKEISVGIEYRVADSNAIFFKESIFEITIGTSPISLLISMPTDINSGKEVKIVVEVVSNSEDRIENVVLSLEYPFGFLFDQSQPKSDVDNFVWRLGDLVSQERRTVHILGTIEGQNDEERTFKFTGGLGVGENAREVSTVLLVAKRSLVIKRPFLQADLAFNGRSDNIFIADPKGVINGLIKWQNNLTIPVEDVVVTAILDGDVLSESSVQVINGFYRSIDNTIIWDKTRVSELSEVKPGATGNLSFSFAPKDPTTTIYKNAIIDVSVEISGDRIGDSSETTGPVSSIIKKTVQLTSDIGIDADIVYSIGPFTNVGPIPPRADQETTYTVTWKVVNTSNNLANTIVSAVLPDYVSFVGTVSPKSEIVTFNPVSSEVNWNIGSLSSGVGYTSAPREVSFQIRFLPSVSQVGSSPKLVEKPTLSAHDTFTDTTLVKLGSSVSTLLSGDPSVDFGDSRVIE